MKKVAPGPKKGLTIVSREGTSPSFPLRSLSIRRSAKKLANKQLFPFLLPQTDERIFPSPGVLSPTDLLSLHHYRYVRVSHPRPGHFLTRRSLSRVCVPLVVCCSATTRQSIIGSSERGTGKRGWPYCVNLSTHYDILIIFYSFVLKKGFLSHNTDFLKANLFSSLFLHFFIFCCIFQPFSNPYLNIILQKRKSEKNGPPSDSCLIRIQKWRGFFAAILFRLILFR